MDLVKVEYDEVMRVKQEQIQVISVREGNLKNMNKVILAYISLIRDVERRAA
jgi:hypothetical protein